MRQLAEQLLEHSRALPEGGLLTASGLDRFGERGAVSRALSRLTRRGELQRIGRGLYVRLIPTRFGLRPPSTELVVASLAVLRNETIASHGAVSANRLALTTQVPVRAIYLTSGPSRSLRLGSQSLELRHAPAWQLVQAGRLSGEVIRALAWLGPSESARVLPVLITKLPAAERAAMADAAPLLPAWLARLFHPSFFEPNRTSGEPGDDTRK